MSSGLPEAFGRLAGKTAIVTGGGRGIGKAVVERFAREGANVMIAEIERSVGDQTAAELSTEGRVVVAAQVDVAEEDQVESLMSHAVKTFGKVDILINNAAIAAFPFQANLSELPLSSWHAMMKNNLDSVLLASRSAARAMMQAGGGYIVNVSSILYLLGVPGLSAYQVAKGAVVTLTRSLALDLAPYGIIVNAIAPGWIDTRHNVETMAGEEWRKTYIESGRIPLRRPGAPSEIASMALALSTADCSYMTGQTLLVDGGLSLTL
jgi:NAD(P)-dependent dehydrogenase (short-subunit alcohol dehydrogenase family)